MRKGQECTVLAHSAPAMMEVQAPFISRSFGLPLSLMLSLFHHLPPRQAASSSLRPWLMPIPSFFSLSIFVSLALPVPFTTYSSFDWAMQEALRGEVDAKSTFTWHSLATLMPNTDLPVVRCPHRRTNTRVDFIPIFRMWKGFFCLCGVRYTDTFHSKLSVFSVRIYIYVPLWLLCWDLVGDSHLKSSLEFWNSCK